MIRLFAAGILVTLAMTAPARAGFGDCMDPDYLAGFAPPDAAVGPLSPVRSITCVIEFDFEFSTPYGPRRMRGIRDAAADWAFRPGALGEVEAGARAAVAAMPALGDFRVDDITILILDDGYDLMSGPPDPEGSVAAVANGDRRGDECLITSFMFGPTGRADEVAFTTAHEIFHCIQAASLTAAQWATTSGGGAWWAEGSAEYFAALAVPARGDLFNRTAAFDAAVAANTPLYEQTYGATVFFYWFHARSGPGALMDFLRAMAGAGGAGAQRSAMRSALSAADWLAFAERYADREIAHPNGSPLAFSGDDGENIYFDESRTERTRLSPFVLRRGWVTFDCGRWRNEVRPGDANLGARREDGGDWARFPAEVDASEGVETRYRFAALHAGDSDQGVAIEADRIHSCRPCADSEELDRCVIGTWVMSGGGPIEWMKSQGVPIIRDSPGTRVIRFGDDGVYYTQEFATHVTIQLDDDIAYGDGVAVPAAGRWSISGGRLAICQDSGGVSGTVTTRSGSMSVAVPGGGVLLNGYSCSASTLETSLDVGGGAPMRTTYSRVSPPPEH